MCAKVAAGALGLIVLGLSLNGAVLASQDCVPVKGKIFNNALGPGSTLGVVHFKYGKKKFECGLQGVGKNRDPSDPNYLGPLNFDHTIVCGDNEGSDSLPIHSQAKWDTSGYATTAPEDCGYGLQSFSFHEESALVPDGATGKFEGATSGHISVDGILYCTLAIDMKFSGEVCY